MSGCAMVVKFINQMQNKVGSSFQFKLSESDAAFLDNKNLIVKSRGHSHESWSSSWSESSEMSKVTEMSE
jgi:hypothetical protein